MAPQRVEVALHVQQGNVRRLGEVVSDREIARGCGPATALKRLRLEDGSKQEVEVWLETSRIEAILGGMRRSMPSFQSGVRRHPARHQNVFPTKAKMAAEL
eukprot:7544063-Karenia_brevis.AAC.1